MFERHQLYNPGVLQGTIPDELFQKIQNQVEKVPLTGFRSKLAAQNNNLVGHLEKELSFIPEGDFKEFLVSMAQEYSKEFDYPISSNPVIETGWINFQKAGEYQPLHTHTGRLSFVVWVKIPYDINKEDNLEMCKNANVKQNGRFVFAYDTQFQGTSIHKIDLDSSWERKIIMFPSKAHHCVYPFYTTDEYRISIAGNIS